MDARLTSRTGFRDSEFANMPDPMDDLAIPDLNNDIHPLFGPDMFQSWSDVGYAMLQLPLRLASRMLLDQRYTEYVETVTNGSLHCFGEDGQLSPEIPIAHLAEFGEYRLVRRGRTPPGLPMPTARYQKCQELLRDLVGTLDGIVLADANMSTGAMTTPTDIAPSTSTLSKFPDSPYKTQINLSEDLALSFMDHLENSARALGCHYLLARSLVHEIAHVLNVAIHGDREAVFYNDSGCNESGFDMDMVVFGGIAGIEDLGIWMGHPKFGQQTWAMVSDEYPRKELVDLYIKAGQPMGIRCELDDYYMTSRIPWRFVASMFTTNFWDNVVPTMTGRPIQPDLVLTWAVRQVEPGEKYINAEGIVVDPATRRTAPCSLLDPSLPARVRGVLDAAVRDQIARETSGT